MDGPCTLLIHSDKTQPLSAADIKGQLQNGTLAQRLEAMKQTIQLTVNGDNMAGISMAIFQSIMPLKDHMLKKLVLLYLEVCEKTSRDGKLLPEMILVCNALRNDLNHPNEYIRGCALRFVCKLKDVELLEPLVPSVKNNLDHRHTYVRRNAVLAIFSLYRSFDYLLPDAPEIIFNFLQKEGDASCQRNAFLMLLNCAQPKVVEYLETITADQVLGFADTLQLMVMELIRKVWHSKPDARAKYLQCAFTMLKSSTPSVQFESATTLVSMTSAPTAIKAASIALIKLLCSESDLNIKLIVLDRLAALKNDHQKVMQGLIMDLLRALSCPNMDIRKKTLAIALDLVTPANVDEVVLSLKREINRAQDEDDKGEYRQLLIRSIHACAARFSGVARNVVHMLMEFLSDSNTLAAVDVVTFVREVMQTYPALRQDVLKNLLSYLKSVSSSRVLRGALWIIGEFSVSSEEIDLAFTIIKEELGDLTTAGQDGPETKEAKHQQQPPSPPQPQCSGNKVLSDGSYATQSAFTEEAVVAVENVGSPLRHLIVASGDFFLASVLATCLTKLVIRSYGAPDIKIAAKNSFCVEVLLVLTALLKLDDRPHAATLEAGGGRGGGGGGGCGPTDPDSYARVCLCIKTLASPHVLVFGEQAFLRDCRDSFASLLLEQRRDKEERDAKKEKKVEVQADDLISLHHLLLGSKLATGDHGKDLEAIDLIRATGFVNAPPDEGQRLERLFQLTGWSDPVYAEAYINVQQYDIVLEVLILNRTADTLQNVSMELSTMGDLKLCERPQNYTIAPFGSVQIKADIKVSSTETGVILGSLVYDVAGSGGDTNYIALNDIHIDILDYITPAHCTHPDFRAMWAEFEWENKVVVNTNFTDLNAFLDHILQTTNMNCLTPKKALEGHCGFLAANLYARSIFGEDALANLSIEKQPDGKVQGFIRIRSKAQGIALSLGDKINLHQNRPKK